MRPLGFRKKVTSLREAADNRHRKALEARMKSLTQAGRLEEAGMIWKALEDLRVCLAEEVNTTLMVYRVTEKP